MGNAQAMKGGDDTGALLIVLAFNEEARIGALVEELRSTLPDVRVLVVDDGSDDRTSERAVAAGAWVVRHPINLGVAAGEATGLQYAIRKGFKAAVRLDGDGQHDPRFVPALLAALRDGAELAIGVRTQEGEGYRAKGLRRVGARMLARLVSTISGLRVTDVTSGFRAFGPRALAFFSVHTPNDYPEPESIVMAGRAGLPVKEVPVVMRPRETGTSSLTFGRSIFYMLKVGFAVVLESMRPSYRE